MAVALSLETSMPRATPKVTAPASEWSVELVEDRSALVKHQAAWDVLAQSAIEPNVFFEPWMFLPAAQFFEPNTPLCCVFVYRRAPLLGAPPILCGFFPFERRRRYRGLPIRSLRLWEPRYVLFTPLVHRIWARETLHVLLDWIVSKEGCPLVEMPMIHGEGPWHQALVDVLNERRMLSFVDEIYTRALIRRGPDAESYCAAALDKERLRNWRRQRRRLSEQGKFETRVLQPDDDPERWIEQFLRLEASGWKGQEKTALGMIESSEAIFRASARNGFALGKLQMLGLFLDEKPIALKCNYLTGAGGFTFKIAYDENYARYSPGVLLELDNIEQMHRRPGLEWLDSCAVPDHAMMNRIWKERRTIQSVTLATSRWIGNSVVGLMPLLRALRAILSNKKSCLIVS